MRSRWSLPLLCTPFISNAIVIRHDVDDARCCRELADEFRVIVTFHRTHGGREFLIGTGTLINDRWVVTAAHVANYLVIGSKVVAHEEVLQVARIVKHANWRAGRSSFDIALVRLNEYPSDMRAVTLYDDSDENELIATFVGRGDFGNGAVGITGSDQVYRAARNQVSDVDGQWIRFVFDRGETALELEGISGPGDSGGPALIERDNILYLIGVSAWQNTQSTNRQEGKYGVIENYSRISYYIDWIDAIVDGES